MSELPLPLCSVSIGVGEGCVTVSVAQFLRDYNVLCAQAASVTIMCRKFALL